jgi:hypothetical protein
MRTCLIILILLLFGSYSIAQPDRWQQRIGYNINVDMNVVSNQFKGIEKIDYWNNSPDTLSRVFFHLYWNAFQPNSMMDIRSRELGKTVLGTDRDGNPVYDWDERVKDRIQHLQPNEIGYDSTSYVKLNGVAQKLIYHETILEVDLKTPLLPHSKNSFEVSFNCQVPIQIRRSGRDNAEGIRYSMSQWYPKMVEYDYEGWNANPYVAREFYGVWGDYNVNISIDKNYMLAGSGTIQNPDEVGYGYQSSTDNHQPSTDLKNGQRSTVNGKLIWKFAAQNVHDFVWAADTAYTMIKKQIPNGPLFYFVYKKVDSLQSAWQNVADNIEKAYPFIAKHFGAYPYKNYSFIQGGDGGMEYPMATLIKNASVGTAVHEFMHSWYQGMMGTNESLYPWMDEGFATYAELRTSAYLKNDTGFAFINSYNSYFRIVKSGKEEALSTHADHYNTNYAYGVASYSKGSMFLSQLGYIVGEENLDKILLEYYNEWRFKHPNPNDFIRIAEKISGIELQWYLQYWINTTRTIDYAIGDINMNNGGNASITLKRIGLMPMPVDVLITYKDGTQQMHYIPMNLMYGLKPAENSITRIVEPEWKWVNPEYSFTISKPVTEIKSIEIDPSQRMADVNRVNNKIVVP